MLAAPDDLGQVHVIVENTTYSKDKGAPWDGKLVDTWVKLTEESTMMSCVVKALEAKGYTFASAELEMVPQTYVTMTGEDDVKNMNKLIDMLEDNEDVQNVWHNWQQD